MADTQEGPYDEESVKHFFFFSKLSHFIEVSMTIYDNAIILIDSLRYSVSLYYSRIYV